MNDPAGLTIGRVTTTAIIDGVSEDVVILIVPDKAQPLPLKVGRSWTELPQVVLVKKDNVVLIGHRDEPPFSNIDIKCSKGKVRLRTLEKVRVQQNVFHWDKVEADRRTDGEVLVSTARGNSNAVITMDQSGVATIPVVSRRDIDMEAGRTLARAEPMMMMVPTDTGEIEGDEMVVAGMGMTSEIMEEDINVSLATQPEDRDRLLTLLNDYKECFATCVSELGCTNLAKMDIEEIPGSQPVRARPYSTNAADREVIRKIVAEWKQQGIVASTTSPYVSPVVLVRKKDGNHRLCVDFRRLNDQTVRVNTPLPLINGQLEKLSGKILFSVLDLMHGYLQVPLADEARAKTEFVTPDGTGQFTRMVFGLCNAPAVFTQLMRTVLGDLQDEVAMCYLNDILIRISIRLG